MTNKTITLPHCRAQVVGVPEEAMIFKMFAGKLCYKNIASQRWWEYYDLPSGNWQLIGVWPEITEKQAAMVVREYGVGMFSNYNNKSGHKMFALFGTAIESLRSLLTSNNLDPNKRWAVLISCV